PDGPPQPPGMFSGASGNGATRTGRARLPPLPVPVEPPAYGTFCRELLDELTIALSTARSPLVSSSRVAVPRRRPAESRLRGIGKLELGRRRYLSVPGCGSSMSWTAALSNEISRVRFWEARLQQRPAGQHSPSPAPLEAYWQIVRPPVRRWLDC